MLFRRRQENEEERSPQPSPEEAPSPLETLRRKVQKAALPDPVLKALNVELEKLTKTDRSRGGRVFGGV